MEERVRSFLEVAHAAAMVTSRSDGTPHVARVALGLADGRVLSSVLPDAVRHAHVLRDPRAMLFVFDPLEPSNARRWLALETTVTIHDGPDAPAWNLRLRKAFEASSRAPAPPGLVTWGGEVMTEDAFLQEVAEEERMVYEFEITRAYGPG